jgi:predicted phosphodiesterase
MRFAAIADVHGNYLALEAVLDDIRAQGISDIVNLGDAASGPLDAAHTIDLLIASNAVSIRGNHDRYLLDRAPEKMGGWDRPAYDQLQDRHFAWLRALPPTRVFHDRVFLCHGTPSSDETYWLETVLPDGQVKLAQAEAIARPAAGIANRLILCGHTHLARAVRLADGRMVANPGSVGSPAFRDVHPYPHVVEAGTVDASYAILEFNADRWQIAFRQVPYDHRAMARLAREKQEMDWANALETGRLSPSPT